MRRWDLADWPSIYERLDSINCFFLIEDSLDNAVIWFTDQVRECLDDLVPLQQRVFYKRGHPWVHGGILRLVKRMQSSVGTKAYHHWNVKCNEAIWKGYRSYVSRTREKLRRLKRGSKLWWSLTKTATNQSAHKQGIGPLCVEGLWTTDDASKCKAFRDSFAKQFQLPERRDNQFSALPDRHVAFFLPHVVPLDAIIYDFLRTLSANSATGPDDIPARFLKDCAGNLVFPIRLLCKRIMEEGTWPESFRLHRICPIHKKNSQVNPENYKGLHITTHISKVIERMIKAMLGPILYRPEVVGPNQFAYLHGRGARDALAYITLCMIIGFATRQKLGVLKSDVRGAFDKVTAARFIGKLQALGIPPNVLKLISSWLAERSAFVELGGVRSALLKLWNQVFQGTVLGPILWNIFFADSEQSIQCCGFEVHYLNFYHMHNAL